MRLPVRPVLIVGAVGTDVRPVVVAYDGSAEATAAVREAATLFGARPLVVLTVWEPGLAAMAMATGIDQVGATYRPDPVEMVAIDRAERDHAARVAAGGVELARELGAAAEPLAVPDEVEVVETIAAIAEERDACAIVIGSRGLGRIRRLLGSTSQGLLRHTRRPVLVVRAPQ
jgi:nucleotide-binding universal stress UspA family protein